MCTYKTFWHKEKLSQLCLEDACLMFDCIYERNFRAVVPNHIVGEACKITGVHISNIYDSVSGSLSGVC